MESAPYRALQIPELLSIIFAQGHDASYLAQYALVCRQWHALATKALWRDNTPDLCSMISMYSAGTLSAYLPHIRNMQLHCGKCRRYRATNNKYNHSALSNDPILCLAKPVSLSVDFNFMLMDLAIIRRITNPNLRSVKFAEGNYGNEILDLLETNFPYLESVEFTNRTPERMDAERILIFLQNMTKLKNILGLLWNSRDETLQHLSQRRNLERLSLDGFQSESGLSTLPSSNDGQSPFVSLQDLDISDNNIIEDRKRILFGLFPNLRMLNLTVYIQTQEADVTSPLANCPHLTDVTILLSLPDEFADTRSLSTASLLAFFRGCPQLKHISIFCFAGRFVSLRRSSSAFLRLIQALPQIRTIALPLECRLGFKEVLALQRDTPHLTSLVMMNSKLNYLDLMHRFDSPVLPRITRFIAGRLHNLTLPQPLPQSTHSGVRKSVQLEIMNRMLPSVALHEQTRASSTNAGRVARRKSSRVSNGRRRRDLSPVEYEQFNRPRITTDDDWD